MTKELAVLDEIERMDAFARLWLEGERNPTTIAKHLKIKRSEALSLIDEYKAMIHSDPEVKARAVEALYEADQSIALAIKEMWETVRQADDVADLKTKATVLKNIPDTEMKRVDMLQRAGMYDDAALGDQLVEMEEKQAILVGILKEVTADCPNCKMEVARRLSKFSGKAEPITVVEVHQQ